VITPSSNYASAPGEPPEPPQIELGRGRYQLFLARMRLALRSFKDGWAIFMESRIGLVSLTIIVTFALMAVSHPILMATVWDADIYGPVTGYAFGQVESPRRQAGSTFWVPTPWAGTCSANCFPAPGPSSSWA
jgi:hypothetical protein